VWRLDEFGQAPALIGEGGAAFSYSDLEREAKELAARVCGRCLVFCLCRNEPGSVLGYVAFINSRNVPLLLDAKMDRGMLDELILNYKPDYLWLPQNMAGQFGEGAAAHTAWNYSLVKTWFEQAYPLHEDLSLLLTTSGSTGSPKLVRHTYENIRSNTEAIIAYLEIDSTERPVTSLPMHYTYGLSVINIHLYVGATIVMTELSLMQKQFWRLFREHEVTSIAGVPYTYEMLHKLHFFRMDLPSLRSLNQAGGKLTPELQKAFIDYAAKTGRRFYVMYGQTEASPRMGYLPWDKAREKYGCMGIAIPGGEFALIGAEGEVITAPEAVGELVYRGPNVTPGYAECGEDLGKGDERRGVLITGDMAKRDADGFYTIVGRKKRFLKIFGNRVSLDETERLVKAAFPNLECACAGRDDALYVFVAGEAKTDEIRNHLAERTKLNPAAFQVRALKEIPKTESGKIQYKELEKFHA